MPVKKSVSSWLLKGHAAAMQVCGLTLQWRRSTRPRKPQLTRYSLTDVWMLQ
jgi:hypothetical protein